MLENHFFLCSCERVGEMSRNKRKEEERSGMATTSQEEKKRGGEKEKKMEKDGRVHFGTRDEP